MNNIDTTQPKNQLPQARPQESSLCRKIHHFFTKIFHDFWVSAACYFSKIEILTKACKTTSAVQKTAKEKFEDFVVLGTDEWKSQILPSEEDIEGFENLSCSNEEEDIENFSDEDSYVYSPDTLSGVIIDLCNIQPETEDPDSFVLKFDYSYLTPTAIAQFASKTAIGQTAVLAYGYNVLEKESENFRLDPRFLMPNCINDQNPDAQLVGIPLIVKGFARDHIVTILVDKANQVIEFYDPKGLTSEDRRNEQLAVNPQMTVSQALEEICLEYPGFRILENTSKHQWDSHNCGVYVCEYFFRRLKEESAVHIFQNGTPFSEINNQVRSNMIVELSYYHNSKYQ